MSQNQINRQFTGQVLAALVLGEFGDDPLRFADARARKNYSGQSPITRASGKKTVVLARFAKNNRLGDALHFQAMSSMKASPGARAYYDAMRSRNIGHHAALRQLANRLVGILHGCLKTATKYDEKHRLASPSTGRPADCRLTRINMGCLTRRATGGLQQTYAAVKN